MAKYEILVSEIVAITYHGEAENEEEARNKYYTEMLDHEHYDTVETSIEEVNELKTYTLTNKGLR